MSKEEQGASPVLVAVDFSDDSRAAFLWAYNYASACGMPLLVLHVVHDPGEAPGYYKHDTSGAMRTMKELAVSMLDDFLIEMADVVPNRKGMENITTVLESGLPVAQVLKTAKASGASCIVTGSQGRTGLKHLLVGSKAEQIVRLATVPVTVVKS